MTKLIVANWKMNPETRTEADRLFKESRIKAPGVEVIICPPFVFLENGRKESLGAQDVHWKKKGPFTGSISVSMLKSLNVKYVIVGHSEREEDDRLVNKKVKVCLSEGLAPIVFFKNRQELEARLEGVRRPGRLVLTYEPPESISANKGSRPTSPEEAFSMSILARRILSNKYSRGLADGIHILYGGSVDSRNASSYELDGLLVGRASLNPRVFKKIVTNVSQKFSHQEQKGAVKG